MSMLSHGREWRHALFLAGAFLAIWTLPLESDRFRAGLGEALALTRWYAREHVVLCLLPAFFIAGAIASFVQQGAVLRYLGAVANRVAAYGVASISGTILVFANWSGSGHPFFATVFHWKWSIVIVSAAGLGVMLGTWFGASRLRVFIVGVIVAAAALVRPDLPLVPFSLGLAGLVWITADAPGEAGEWWRQTWSFTKQVMPLLLGGVFVAGLLLGRPGHEGWIPSGWVATAVGGDGWIPAFWASLAGALMYFATLTEIPIVEGLQGAGMGSGAALALLLAGPALSLPNMIVIRSIIGTRKTLGYVTLVVGFSTVAGHMLAPLLPA